MEDSTKLSPAMVADICMVSEEGENSISDDYGGA